MGLVSLGVVAFSALLAFTTVSPDGLSMICLVFGIPASAIVSIIGLTFGLVALSQEKSSSKFPILGIVINSIGLLPFIATVLSILFRF